MLIAWNDISESTISGIGGTNLSNDYQESELGLFNNNWYNNKGNEFIDVLTSIMSEDGNKIISRLENDIPQYVGGW